MTVLKDKISSFGKQRYDAKFMKNCMDISKSVTVNYKHRRPKMDKAIKKTDKPVTNAPKYLEHMASMVEILSGKISTSEIIGMISPSKKMTRKQQENLHNDIKSLYY